MSLPLRLVAGRIFAGDYKIVRPLKAGGQGSLYVVEQVSTSKLRALKLMLPELVAQPSSRRRFELEAKIAARIQSDHVVESIASGVDGPSGTPWLVMELLEGEDLASYTQKRRHLPPAEVLEIFSQLCHALGEAHRQGIIHRDLKPENIFLATPRRRGVPFMVKVLDFGIARILAESQTQSGSTTSGLGTPMWMAPEQTQPGSPVGAGTDVWPLGLLAFRLLTGYLFWKAPYEKGASVMMLMAEAFMHPLPTASERAAHYKCPERLPPGFDAWFARCVARPMEDRFADAAETFGALEPLLVTFGVDAPLPSRAIAGRADALSPRAPAASLTPSSRSEPDARPSAVPATPALGPLKTGPGLATWGGAPELAADAVRSATDSDPPSIGTPPEPVPSSGTPPEDTPVAPGDTPGPPAPALTTGDVPSSRTADQAPPVQTTAPPLQTTANHRTPQRGPLRGAGRRAPRRGPLRAPARAGPGPGGRRGSRIVGDGGHRAAPGERRERVPRRSPPPARRRAPPPPASGELRVGGAPASGEAVQARRRQVLRPRRLLRSHLPQVGVPRQHRDAGSVLEHFPGGFATGSTSRSPAREGVRTAG